MNEDQLKHSLEDLFSDASFPEPETTGDVEALREGAPDDEPTESLWEGAGGGHPGARDLEGAPSPRPETSRSSDRSKEHSIRRPETTPAVEKGVPLPATRRPRADLRLDSAWRQKLLRASLYAALVVGGVAAGLGSYRAYAAGRIVLLPFTFAAYLLLLLVTLWEQVPYNAQVVSFLGLIYGLGLLDLIRLGSHGDGRIYLLVLPGLATLFVGRLQGVIALLISFSTQALLGWAISVGHFVPLEYGAVSTSQTGWWWAKALTFLFLGSGSVIIQNRLAVYLDQAAEHGHKLTAELATYCAHLSAQRQALKQRDLQLDLMVELGRIATSKLGVDDVLHRAVRLVPDYLNCYLASVFLLDEGGEVLTLRAAAGPVAAELEAEGLRLPVRDTSIVGWAAGHRRPYVARDVSADDLYRPHPFLGGTMSEAAVPLTADGLLLGVLDVQAGSRDAFGEIDVRVLRGVADQLAMVVRAARYASDETALLEATSPLYRTSHRLNDATTLDEVVQVIVDAVEETEADGCLIGMFERSFAGRTDCVRYLGSWQEEVRDGVGTEVSSQSQRQRLRPGVTLSLVEGPLPTSLLEQFWGVADVEQDDRLWEQARQVLKAIDARGCVNVPLRNRDTDVGHLLVLREKPGSFSRNSMRLFEVLAKQAAVALARARQLEEARRRARREELASKATARMHESLDLESVLNTAVRDIGETLGLAALGVRLGPVPASLGTGGSMPGNGGGSQSQIEREEE